MRDTTVATSYYAIGDTHDGVINGIKDYGAFVQLGQGSGLCHVRAYGKAIAHASLARGHRVTVRVLAVRDDGKLSLALLAVKGVKAAPDRMAGVTGLYPIVSIVACMARLGCSRTHEVVSGLLMTSWGQGLFPLAIGLSLFKRT